MTQTTGLQRRGFILAAASLAAFVLLTYLPQISELPPRGEETRWATVAREMAASGDWIVPRQQGEPFYSRPPLGSWLIGIAARLRGELDIAAVRLPTVCAVIVTSLTVFWYAAKSMAASWAFLAGLAFALCVQVLQLGRVGETDVVFAFLVAGSMLSWRGLWREDGPTTWSWLTGYALTALAMLAKGPQGPAYFVAAAIATLLVERKAWALCTRGHAAGAAVFSTVVLAWYVPAVARIGSAGAAAFWTGDVALRWEQGSFGGWARHLVEFPLELCCCLLPWSVLLLPLVKRDIRAAVFANGYVRFALTAVAVAFPTCWLTPNARVRYFLPLFPAMAVIAAATLRETVVRANARGIVWTSRRVVGGALACAVLFSAADNGIRVPMLKRKADDTEGQVATLRKRFDGEGLIPSIGPVHHRFAYFYRDPVPLIAEDDAGGVKEGSLFTVSTNRKRLFAPPFAYEEVARIPCDSAKNSKGPIDFVLVGRRLAAVADATKKETR